MKFIALASWDKNRLSQHFFDKAFYKYNCLRGTDVAWNVSLLQNILGYLDFVSLVKVLAVIYSPQPHRLGLRERVGCWEDLGMSGVRGDSLEYEEDEERNETVPLSCWWEDCLEKKLARQKWVLSAPRKNKFPVCPDFWHQSGAGRGLALLCCYNFLRNKAEIQQYFWN